MSTAEYIEKYGREAPSPRERKLAATIRVRSDKARGVATPEWIVELANSAADAAPQNNRVRLSNRP